MSIRLLDKGLAQRTTDVLPFVVAFCEGGRCLVVDFYRPMIHHHTRTYILQGCQFYELYDRPIDTSTYQFLKLCQWSWYLYGFPFFYIT